LFAELTDIIFFCFVLGLAGVAIVGFGDLHGRVHFLLDHLPLLPLEAGHARHAVVELAIGGAKLGALLSLNKSHELC
jgi:hypothetical protein